MKGRALAPLDVDLGGGRVRTLKGDGAVSRLDVGEVAKSKPSFDGTVFGPTSFPDGSRRGA